MPRSFRFLVMGVAAVFCASLGLLLAHGMVRRGPDPLAADENVRDLAIPPFTMTTQDGRTIVQGVFEGHVTIVDFFFTRCTLICPLLTQQMADQLRALQGSGVRSLSICVDPEHDTAETVAAYAKEHGADPARWMFARTDRATLMSIVKGMKFDLSEDAANPIKLGDGATMPNIVHPSWFALVGPKGEVLGIYLATNEDAMRELTARARAASEELGAAARK